jgi:rhamnose utilization protein RhaD (predicted bifunctional aldolase and dehydrogenase)
MARTRTSTHHTSRGAAEALRELITISRAVGADPDLVQGGGGNTSVKTRDGVVMVVKASGTSLADMDPGRGWALLDLARLRSILAVKGLSALPSARREKRVLELLAGTVIRPAGARPSVESNLHALLDRVVIHTHPVGLNVLLCSRRSRELSWEVVGKPRGEPLYVPYIDPGYTLAARMEVEIARYRRRHGAPPAVVLLENHGLFVAAPEVEECLALSKEITDRGRRFIGGKRVNPLVPSAAMNGAGKQDGAAQDVRGALLEGGGAPLEVRRDDTPLAREFLDSPEAMAAARQGAFTPDQIVYCRTQPLVLPPEDERRFRAVESYRSRYGLDPRVVLSPGIGIFYAAPDLRQLRIVGEVYRSAMAAILRSARAGGPRFLTRRQARFIEGWEVEAFRARLSAGAVTHPRSKGRKE